MRAYRITNLANGLVYIGVTTRSMEYRYQQHWQHARRGLKDHPLYNAMREHGEAAFRVELVAEAASFPELWALEERLVREHGATDPSRGYNLRGGGKGGAMSEAAIEKMRRREFTPEHRENLAAARRGKKHSPETLALMRARRASPETRAKMSAAQKGRKPSQATLDASKAANTGRVRSPETLKRMSEAQVGKQLSEDHKAKIGAAGRGRALSPKARQALLDGNRARAGKPCSPRQLAHLQRLRDERARGRARMPHIIP